MSIVVRFPHLLYWLRTVISHSCPGLDMDTDRLAAFAVLVACAGIAGVAGCNFDEGIAGDRCSDEGAYQNGYACREGVWQGIDLSEGTDVDRPGEDASSAEPDAGSPPVDGTAPVDGSSTPDGSTADDGTSMADGSTPVDGKTPVDGESPRDGTSTDDGTSTGQDADSTVDATESDTTSDTESTTDSGTESDTAPDGGDDTGAGCTPGETRPCYTGPSGTEGVGACEAGEQTCKSDGTWGDCTDEVVPVTEVCDDGVDNDCDGDVDEDCTCNYQGKAAGVCAGQPEQSDGSCPEPDEYESRESSCEDGLDNDCDGDADGADADCRRPPGDRCTDDAQCRSVCIANTCAHRVFVSSDTYRGGFGGLSDGDQKCQNLANAVGADGTWKAILSDYSTAARDRLTIKAPVATWDGVEVASGKSDLWDSFIDTPIGVTEQNNDVQRRVWTGTNPDGTRDHVNDSFGSGQYCNDWKANAPQFDGEAGSTIRDDYRWLLFNNYEPDCDQSLSLYCIDGQ